MPSLRVCQPAPCVRGARARAGWRGAAVWLLVLGGCGPTPAAPTSPSTVRAEYPEFVTYTGSVLEPYPSRMNGFDGTGGPRGLAGVRVTIVGGQPHGRTAVTDAAGRFEFADYPFCPLYTAECQSRRFRAEKAGYETREVGASDLFYELSGGLNTRGSSAEYKRIFMGRAWPPDPRLARMRRELPAMKDIWLVELAHEWTVGSYEAGVIAVKSFALIGTIAHEYCHAHQDWAIDPNAYDLGPTIWLQSPEGRAFLAAYEADRATGDPYFRGQEDRIPLFEIGASVCNMFFRTSEPTLDSSPWNRQYMRDRLPHLHAWAEEWLRWP